MTPDTFVDSISERAETPLSRLGSSKALYADTEGELEPDQVRTAARRDHAHARNAFAEWRSTTSDPLAEEIWADAVDVQGEILSAIGDGPIPDDVPAIATALGDQDTPLDRAAATVGWAVAIGRKTDQVTGFFVGQADPGAADRFRTIGDRIEDQRDRALDLLAATAEDNEEWATAEDTATAVIDAAYEEYVEVLESLGVNPKPVC